MKRSNNSRTNIWEIVALGHELDGLSARVHLLATQLNHGHVDSSEIVTTLRQLQRCSLRLAILNRRRT
jgi:hypothetical protein